MCPSVYVCVCVYMNAYVLVLILACGAGAGAQVSNSSAIFRGHISSAVLELDCVSVEKSHPPSAFPLTPQHCLPLIHSLTLRASFFPTVHSVTPSPRRQLTWYPQFSRLLPLGPAPARAGQFQVGGA